MTEAERIESTMTEVGATDVAAPRWRVVRNDEEQYSLWPARRDLPAGWLDVGVGGTEEECLAYIETVWTDMRPRRLREART